MTILLALVTGIAVLVTGNWVALLVNLQVARGASLPWSVIPVALLGGALIAASIPSTMVFTNPSLKGRLVFGAVSLIAIALGIFMAADTAAHPLRPEIFSGSTGNALTGLILICAASTWLGMVPSLHSEKPE